jgi:leucyl aminopeptidase
VHPSLVKSASHPIPLFAVTSDSWKTWLTARPKHQQAWLKSARFSAKEGQLVRVPGADGALAFAILGLGKGGDPLALATFSESLADGQYALLETPADIDPNNATLAWLLGRYVFSRYRKPSRAHPRLVLPEGVDGEDVTRIAEAVFFARDLVNTPSNDMGPEELAAAADTIAVENGAGISTIVGEELLAKNYPLIHAVGRAAVRTPLLIDMRWGDARAPKITLVGKGVCFDSGGLDLKPSSGMSTMKKDMGGAAVVLAVARMVMGAGLHLRLRVLIPAVENAVSGNAYRPGDVLPSRKGLSIEVGNTDAEGRLVLADALADADDEEPEILIDVATLTGAARAATGMEVPPFFTDDELLAADLMRVATKVHDPLWRLPLWRGYEPTIASPIADLNNNPDYNLAGAITAALFLNRFVERAKSWVHFDIPAWIDRPRPGRPRGGEANAARALYALLKDRYGDGHAGISDSRRSASPHRRRRGKV